MANIKIVTDSNSGITQAEAKELGIFVVPMPFLINGEEYFEDINLTQKEFYEHLQGDAAVSTSQPSAVTVTELWDELLKDGSVHFLGTDMHNMSSRRPETKEALGWMQRHLEREYIRDLIRGNAEKILSDQKI